MQKLSKTTLAIIVAVLVLFIGGLICSVWTVATYNRQVHLSNLIEAKVEANKTDLSNLKSKFSEVAQVTDEQMSRLSELFNGYASARTKDSAGALSSWVKEAVPNVDQATFTNLQNIIVASRDGWTNRQKELVDQVREYNTALDTFPSGIVLKIFGFEKKKAIIVITSDTRRAFDSGTDEPTSLFKKN